MKCATKSPKRNGAMVELVDTSVLGTDFFGSEGSSPFRPTLTTNVDRSVYSIVYETSRLSTIAIMGSVVYKEKSLGDGLRKNHTFHLNDTCAKNSLSTRCFFNLTSSTHLWWSCRRYKKTPRRRTPVLVSHKEMFSQCPQKLTRHHYSYN